MTRRWRWTMAAAAAALCGCVSMAESDPLPAEALPTPQQIVAARQAAYHLSGAMMGQMKATIDRGGDV